MIQAMRPIRIDGDVAYVPLTKGYVATIDASDVRLVLGRNWSVFESRNRRYAVRGTEINGKTVRTYMHRLFLDVPEGMLPDHKEGDGLDNRRSNLRIATYAQNAANAPILPSNTTGFKGVVLNRGRYVAYIKINGRRKYLGRFGTPEEAHEAYWANAQEIHGEFARKS